MVLKYLSKKKCVICGTQCDYVGKTNIKEVYSIQIRDIIRALGKTVETCFYSIYFIKKIFAGRDCEGGDYLCRKHKILNNEFIDSTSSLSSLTQSQKASNFSVNESDTYSIFEELTDLDNNIESIDLNKNSC
jgi:hypothetical protein